MVKEENAHYHTVNKFVVAFLTSDATPELIEKWKSKSNLHKLKSTLKKTDRPSHPPRPKSEYIYFCQEVRPLIQEEMRRELDGDQDRKIDIHEVTCKLGQRWKQFKQVPDPEMKKRIAELARNDNKRYHTEKEAMHKKETTTNNHLKSMYLYFCKEERAKNPKITLANVAVLWAASKNDEKLACRYKAAKLAAKTNQPIE